MVAHISRYHPNKSQTFWETVMDPDYCHVCCDNPDRCNCGAVEHKEPPDMQIIFNGERFTPVGDTLSYEGIASMVGYDNPTVTFFSDGKSGTLQPGRTLHLEDNMVIDAVRTGAA
jgi:hypothetical protein